VRAHPRHIVLADPINRTDVANRDANSNCNQPAVLTCSPWYSQMSEMVPVMVDPCVSVDSGARPSASHASRDGSANVTGASCAAAYLVGSRFQPSMRGGGEGEAGRSRHRGARVSGGGVWMLAGFEQGRRVRGRVCAPEQAGAHGSRGAWVRMARGVHRMGDTHVAWAHGVLRTRRRVEPVRRLLQVWPCVGKQLVQVELGDPALQRTQLRVQHLLLIYCDKFDVFVLHFLPHLLVLVDLGAGVSDTHDDGATVALRGGACEIRGAAKFLGGRECMGAFRRACSPWKTVHACAHGVIASCWYPRRRSPGEGRRHGGMPAQGGGRVCMAGMRELVDAAACEAKRDGPPRGVVMAAKSAGLVFLRTATPHPPRYLT
jgi:hypothetical protein